MTYFLDMDSAGRELTPGVHVTLGGFVTPQSFEEERAIEQLEKRHYSFSETRRILIERMEQAEKERREMYAREARECALLSESALEREWDTPEEDVAWAQLSMPHFCSMCLSGHVHEGRGDGPCTHREENTVCVCNWSSADIEALRERVEREWMAKKWEVMERDADEDIAAGRYTTYTNMQALMDDMFPGDEPDPHAAPTGDLAPGQEREDDV